MADNAVLANQTTILKNQGEILANQKTIGGNQKTIIKNQYKPGFMLKLMCKDILLALDTCEKLGVPSFAGTVSAQVLDLVKDMGHGNDDFTVVATLYQNAAGVIIGKEE